ncbi:MAG TPA: SNF2-related protein, partial [Opitutus sp.]|nr:SNF2-related protein [Opitutus sp.]
MLRLHLPPNLAAAAPRDAIAVKVELDLSTPPAPELLPALALLQRWCGTTQPPAFLQLTRAQLRDLAAAVGAQPVFIENGRATAFRHASLLVEPSPPVNTSRDAAPRKNPTDAHGSPLLVDGSEHFLAVTLPSREHPSYPAALELVKTSGFILEPSNRKWWLRDRHKTLNFLAEHGSRLRTEFNAQFTPNFGRNTARLRPAEIATEITELGGDFNVTLSVRAGGASDDAVRAAVTARRSYVESGGEVFLLDGAKLQQLDAAQHALAGAPGGGPVTRRTHRVSRARLPEAQEILETLSPSFQPPEAWRARSEALRDMSRLAPAPVPATLDGQLRPYQRLGAAWLWHLHRHELGGILADEMGLGKTLQALALLIGVAQSGPRGSSTALVVCPASLLENWRREAARFAPELRVFVHHGERRLTTVEEFTRIDMVVTSYGTLTRDWELFSRVAYCTVIADEAQHIKNRRSQNAAAL